MIYVAMEPPDEEKEEQTLVFRFTQSKSAADMPIPSHPEVDEAIEAVAQMGNPALLAVLLKMVLNDRITNDEIQLICDVFYHD
jgi:hypothetical protein